MTGRRVRPLPWRIMIRSVPVVGAGTAGPVRRKFGADLCWSASDRECREAQEVRRFKALRTMRLFSGSCQFREVVILELVSLVQISKRLLMIGVALAVQDRGKIRGHEALNNDAGFLGVGGLARSPGHSVMKSDWASKS